MADACAKLLRTLEPRQVFLSHLDLALPQYDQTLLISLPLTLSHQTQLVTVTLPSYSATRDVVAALGRLPHLKEYAIWDFLAYQMPLEAGATFEWPLGSFVSLEKLSFIAPLTDASEIMGKEHQSRLRSLEIACRTPAQHHQLQSLSTKLSASLPHLTSLSLFLYSETFVPNTPEGLRFHSLHPLLQCRALSILVVGHNIPLAYTQNDIRTMAEAWPAMKFLRLCADPVDTVRYSSGQPLGSVGVFARYFPHLLLLGIYINTFEIPLKSKKSTGFRALGVLDVGTSPDAGPTMHLSVSPYLEGILKPTTILKSDKTPAHISALRQSLMTTREYARRAASWASVASGIDLIRLCTMNLATETQPLTTQNDALSNEVERLKIA
ncbi:hypothetical protein FRB93_002832 [Tulasnella sp. JGI-2019a]|nr:hypothetical protein FRB93_002832 [Tulasnella sp. JGI-2019a]